MQIFNNLFRDGSNKLFFLNCHEFVGIRAIRTSGKADANPAESESGKRVVDVVAEGSVDDVLETPVATLRALDDLSIENFSGRRVVVRVATRLDLNYSQSRDLAA